MSEAVAVVPDKLEDSTATTCRETATVDVWMQWKNPATGALTESYTLPGAIQRGLQGNPLNAAPTRVYAVIARRLGPRMVEELENLVHTPISVELWRVL